MKLYGDAIGHGLVEKSSLLAAHQTLQLHAGNTFARISVGSIPRLGKCANSVIEVLSLYQGGKGND